MTEVAALRPIWPVESKDEFRAIYVQPIIDKSKGLIWACDIKEHDKMVFEFKSADENTAKFTLDGVKTMLDKEGKPVIDSKTGKPVAFKQQYLSAPFVPSDNSRLIGLGNINDKKFPPKLGSEQRKIITTNHPPIPVLADDKEAPKVNTWMKQMFDVAEAFKRACALTLLKNEKMGFGPPKLKGKDNINREHLNNARELLNQGKEDQAVANVYKYIFGEITKLSEETEWDWGSKQPIATGRKKGEDHRYMAFTTGFAWGAPKNEDGQKPRDPPPMPTDPVIIEHMKKVNAQAQAEKAGSEPLLYYPPEISWFNGRAKPPVYVSVPLDQADSPLFARNDLVMMVSYTMGMKLGPDGQAAFSCYLKHVYVLGFTRIPVPPKVVSAAPTVNLDKLSDQQKANLLKYQEEEEQADSQQSIQSNLKRYQDEEEAVQDEKTKKAKELTAGVSESDFD